MNKTEKNKMILQLVKNEIARRNLTGKLEMYGCTNTFQRRPRFWKSNGCCYFKVLMWDLNSLDDDTLEIEIGKRVDSAVAYFRL